MFEIITTEILIVGGGGAGVYFTDPDLADDTGRKTLNAMKSGTLVTGCPFCKEQFAKLIADGNKVLHYIEAFDRKQIVTERRL